MTQAERKGRDGSAGYRIFLLHWLEAMVLDRLLGPFDLKRGQVATLADVLEQEEILQDAINGLQGTDKSATTRTLQILEAKGLVSRREDPANRRRKLVRATDKARDLEPAFFRTLHRNNSILLQGFGPREREECLRYLDRMIDNLKEFLAPGAEHEEL